MIKKILAVSLLAMSQSVFALSDARSKLNDFFTNVNNMQGSFIQQVYNKSGKVTDTAEGSMTLQRPGKFNWQYVKPDPQKIISDGKNIWLYDKDLDQVMVKPLSEAVNNTPAAILMQKAIPDTQFKVMEMDAKTSGWDWFYLQPHRKSNDFKAIQLGMDKQGHLRQMVMYDQIGQKTVITFNAKTNVNVAQNTFAFTPPAGVDVIGTPE